MTIKTEKELAAAIKNGDDYIEIEGDLKKKVLRIKASGKVVWSIALAAISIAVGSVIAGPTTGGMSLPISFIAAPAAVGILGVSVTTTAIGIAIAAGGIGVLNKLRNYKVVEKNEKRLILKK